MQARHALQSGKERAHGSYSCLGPCLSAPDGREALSAHFLLSRAALTRKVGAYVFVHLHEQLLRVKPTCADRIHWPGTCAQHQCRRYHSACTDAHGRRGRQAREFVIPESGRVAYREIFCSRDPTICRLAIQRARRKKVANACAEKSSVRSCPRIPLICDDVLMTRPRHSLPGESPPGSSFRRSRFHALQVSPR